jgi:predicted NAD-dependent protein-ADP-ribosyltransferase YbiA (DUF1768 family)
MQSIGHIEFDSGDLEPVKQDNILGPIGTPASSSFELDGRTWKNPYHYYYANVLEPMLTKREAEKLKTYANWRTPIDKIAEHLGSFSEGHGPFPLPMKTHMENIDVMERALVAMLEQNSIARRSLLRTRNAYIVYCPDEQFRDMLWSYSESKQEFKSSHKTFADVRFTGEYKNSYGELLMCLRDVFKPTDSEVEAEREAAMAAGAATATAGESAQSRKLATPPASPRADNAASSRTPPAQGGDDGDDADDDDGPIGGGGTDDDDDDDDDDGGGGADDDDGADVAALAGIGAEYEAVAATDAEYEAFLDSLVADAFSDSDDLPSDDDAYGDDQYFGSSDMLDDEEREQFANAIQNIFGDSMS